jgi:ubiquinone/menaquinone biosynthesis C-methylase UbiE
MSSLLVHESKHTNTGDLMTELRGLWEQRAAFYSRTEQYLRLGLNRFAAADFVTAAAGTLSGPALDIGTGKGITAMALAGQGLDVVSVDIDAVEQSLAALLAEESGFLDRISFVCSDASTLSFPENHFGCAVMMDVLHHLVDPIPVLEEVARVLKPSGTFILADFSAEGFVLLNRVLHEEGREHAVSGVTLKSAEISLSRKEFAPIVHCSAHYHEVAVLVKNAGY